jgi:hypothetical protein
MRSLLHRLRLRLLARSLMTCRTMSRGCAQDRTSGEHTRTLHLLTGSLLPHWALLTDCVANHTQPGRLSDGAARDGKQRRQQQGGGVRVRRVRLTGEPEHGGTGGARKGSLLVGVEVPEAALEAVTAALLALAAPASDSEAAEGSAANDST